MEGKNFESGEWETKWVTSHEVGGKKGAFSDYKGLEGLSTVTIKKRLIIMRQMAGKDRKGFSTCIIMLMTNKQTP